MKRVALTIALFWACASTANGAIAVVQVGNTQTSSTVAFTTNGPANGNVVVAVYTTGTAIIPCTVTDSNSVALVPQVSESYSTVAGVEIQSYLAGSGVTKTFTITGAGCSGTSDAFYLLELSGVASATAAGTAVGSAGAGGTSISTGTIASLGAGGISVCLGNGGATLSGTATINGTGATQFGGVNYSYYLTNAGAIASSYSCTVNFTGAIATGAAAAMAAFNASASNPIYPDPGSMTYRGGNWLAFESRFYEKILVARALRTLGDRTLARSGAR